MASPLPMFIAPNTGVEIQLMRPTKLSKSKATNITSFTDSIQLQDIFSSRNPDDIRQSWEYRLSNEEQFHLLPGTDFSKVCMGKMSPTSTLTLTPYAKKQAGILYEKATRYAYLAPPMGLANCIDWKEYYGDESIDDDGELNLMTAASSDFFEDDPSRSSKTIDLKFNELRMEWAAPLLAVTGAFVYFDDEMNVCGVNVITLKNTDYSLSLSGPFKTPKLVVNALSELDRISVCPLQCLHENSYVALSWVLSHETFENVGPTQGRNPNKHGSFLFMRYDGTAETYAVVTSSHTNYDEESSILPDVFSSSSCRSSKYAELAENSSFAEEYIDDSKIQKWKKYITSMCYKLTQNDDPDNTTVTRPRSLEGETSLIHEACRSRVDIKHIITLLENSVERDALLQQDKFGWVPLHYLCAFSAENKELISFVIEESPEAVYIKDSFGRYPLHIACDNPNTHASVVKMLLGEKEDLVLKPTKYLKRLPLHIALDRGLDASVIAILLDADGKFKSIRATNDISCRPIHSALKKRLSAQTISLLLEADANLYAGEDDEFADIYSKFRGLLPIHIACLTGASRDVVSLLLDKDISGKTLVARAEGSITKNAGIHLSLRESIRKGSTEGKIPVHLAIARRSVETIKLLLKRAEIEGESDESIYLQDKRGRVALHMACINNISHEVVKLLINIDKEKVNVGRIDSYGKLPIHYACDHKDAQKKSVSLLLHAEREREEIEMTDNNNANHSRSISDGKSPIWYAVKAGAPADVLETLMKEDGFCLEGFDRRAMRKDLAEVIKDKTSLQKLLNKRLAIRRNNVRINLRFVADLGSLICFYIAIEQYAVDERSDVIINFLWFFVSIFILNELEQIRIESLKVYLLELSNWYEMTMIALLSLSVTILFSWEICDSNNGNESICTHSSILFTATGILLVVNVVKTLQGFFLPFALFGSGLYNIFKTLTPFLTVSLLILVAFTNSYRIAVNFADENTTWDPETTHGQCVESFSSCFLTVLQGFFGGGGDATTGWLDIAFGILIAIILLNVVIAIVSDSWEDSKGTAAYAFWSSRVERLSQLGKSAKISKHNIFLFTWIDSLRWIPFQDDISWSKDYPFSLVQSREEYENPYYYFSKRDARKIANSRSLDSSLYWIRKDTDLGLMESEVSQAYTSFKWLMNNTVYMFLVLLGPITVGLSWPAEFSVYFMNIGLDTYKNDSTSSNNDSDGQS